VRHDSQELAETEHGDRPPGRAFSESDEARAGWACCGNSWR
jgi:hypothetical protein